MEGSLKLKEISYIHSESYAAGELKHGTISLVEDGMPVIGVATQTELLEKTVKATLLKLSQEEHLQLPYARKEQNLVRA